MFTTTSLVVALAGFAALGAAARASPCVRILTYTEDNCGGAGTFLYVDKDVCINFAEDVKSLRVTGVDGSVRYNALHVYPGAFCSGGWSLQPTSTDACSAVVAYKSIALLVNTDHT